MRVKNHCDKILSASHTGGHSHGTQRNKSNVEACKNRGDSAGCSCDSASDPVLVQTSAEPTPDPTPELTAIRMYAYGRQLDADGITLYVGDKPVEIYLDLEPEGLNLPVEWSFSNPEAVSLEVSDDGMKCTVTVLQPKGKNELKVVCHNLYTTIPVYLWEK